MSDSIAVALDVGGTKLAAGIVDGTGAVSHRSQTPTPADDGEAMWDAVTGLLDELLERTATSPQGIGVGCGGPMRWPVGEVSPLNIPAWRDFPLRERLRERYELPVRLHNDAVAVAIGEHWRGAGRGRANVLGMVVSTGVGGGLVLGGRVVDGAGGNAGHIGHLVVDPSGPECACGGRGCIEAIASGPRTIAWALEQGWQPAKPDGKSLAAAARSGESVPIAALARAGHALGVGIASAVTLCDVELVCLGGGLSQAGDLLFEPLRAAYAIHAGLSFAREVPVVAAELGQDAGLVGAGALVLAPAAYWSPVEG